MKKQIVFIHGGSAYTKYENFLNDLKTMPIQDIFGIEKTKKWKETLKENFRETYDVLYPSMPNSSNAKYTEWKIWFERYFEYLTGDVILIGHSQGGYFLAKYLSENVVPFSILGLFLVATPFGPDDFGGEDGGDFKFDTENLINIEKMAQNIIIYHSKDDEVVPYSHSERYHTTLPKSEYTLFNNRGHFVIPEFPEIIERIKLL